MKFWSRLTVHLVSVSLMLTSGLLGLVKISGRWIAATIVAVLLVVVPQSLAAAECVPGVGRPCVQEGLDAVTIVVNGVTLPLSPPAFEEGNHVMAPMRAVLEAAGATVTWNEAEQSETAVLGHHSVKVWMGTGTALEGTTRKWFYPSRLIDDRVFAPVRAVAEALGGRVTWDDATRTELINFPLGEPAFVSVQDQPLYLQPGAFLEGEVVVVPARAVFEAAGARVTWHEAEQAETFEMDCRWVKVWMGSRQALVSGVARKLPTEARLIQDRVFVPLQMVAEALGLEALWEPDTHVAKVIGYNHGWKPCPEIVNGTHKPLTDGDVRIVTTYRPVDGLQHWEPGGAKAQIKGSTTLEVVTDKAFKIVGEIVKEVVVELDVLDKFLSIFGDQSIVVDVVWSEVYVEKQAQVYQGGEWKTLYLSQAIARDAWVPATFWDRLDASGRFPQRLADIRITDTPRIADPPQHFDDDKWLMEEAYLRWQRGIGFHCEDAKGPGCQTNLPLSRTARVH